MSVIARSPGTARSASRAWRAPRSPRPTPPAGSPTSSTRPTTRRSPDERDVDDLRLAFGILTTRWHRLGRRLRAHDVARLPPRVRRRRGFAGARAALGRSRASSCSRARSGCSAPGSPTPTRDPARARLGHRVPRPPPSAPRTSPSGGSRDAALGRAHAAAARRREQAGTTYPAVPLPSARRRARGARPSPRAGPTSAARSGASPPLRSGGLAGPDVRDRGRRASPRRARRCSRAAMSPRPRCSTTPAAIAAALEPAAAGLGGAAAAAGRDPAAAAAADHARGPLPRLCRVARGRVGAGRAPRSSATSASGTRCPRTLPCPFRLAGRAAQSSFWGGGAPEDSMLHQLALAADAHRH